MEWVPDHDRKPKWSPGDTDWAASAVCRAADRITLRASRTGALAKLFWNYGAGDPHCLQLTEQALCQFLRTRQITLRRRGSRGGMGLFVQVDDDGMFTSCFKMLALEPSPEDGSTTDRDADDMIDDIRRLDRIRQALEVCPIGPRGLAPIVQAMTEPRGEGDE